MNEDSLHCLFGEGQRELEAEAIPYAVLEHYGIHVHSSVYLAAYEVTSEMLTASLQTIGNTAKRLIHLIMKI